jgi:hypothetical protein
MKAIFLLFVFAIMIAALKPMPNVEELTKVINDTCKGDICGKN